MNNIINKISNKIASLSGMNHITLAVTNLDRSFNFYKDVLGFRPIVRFELRAYFLIGEKNLPSADQFWFCLNVDSKRKSIPSDCYTHFAFTVEPAQFKEMAVKIVNFGAEIFQENSSPGESLYFIDPDGHKLEIHSGKWWDRLAHKSINPGKWQNNPIWVRFILQRAQVTTS